MNLPERDVQWVLNKLAVIRGRVHKLIRVRELTASRKLEQIRSVQC